MMSRAQAGRLRALTEEALRYHKTTSMCEAPGTCGGCHWWGGYLAAINEIIASVDPNTASAEALHPALVRARERLEAGRANRQHFADQDRSCPADYACPECGWTGQHSLGCASAPQGATPQERP